MSESGRDTSRLPDAQPAKPATSMRPVLQTFCSTSRRPLIAYYGLRALGASEYVALLSATVLSGLQVVYGAVKSRRLDPFAAYLLLTFGLSLAVGLATTDPKLILAGNTFVNGLGGLIFLGSCVVGTPLTQVVAAAVPQAGGRCPTVDEATGRDGDPRSALGDVGHRPAARGRDPARRDLASLSVDAANGVNTAITLSDDRPAGVGDHRRRAPGGIGRREPRGSGREQTNPRQG